MAPGGITVLPAGVIIGNGMITTPDLVNHGVVSPAGEERGATHGILTLNGNYTQGPTGHLDIAAAGPQCPQSDRLVVTGTAVLNGGTLLLSGLNGFTAQPNTHYTILTAVGGLTGNFSQVVDTLNTSGLTRANITTPNGIVITYLAPGFGALNLRSTLPIDLNNPCAVDPILINTLDPNANQLAAPFDVWISGFAQTTRFTLQDHFDDLMAAPTRSPPIAPPSGKQTVGKGVISGKEALPPPAPAPEKPRFSLWGSGFGSWQDLSSEGMAHGFHYVNAGFLAGGDFHFLENYVVGLFGVYAHAGDSLLDGNTGWGDLYAGFYKRGAYILGAVYGGGGSFDTSRSTIVGGRAKGTADTQQWASFVTVGYDFRPLGKLVVGPVFSASYAYAKMDSFTEHSSCAPLRVFGSSQEDWRTDLGFRCLYGPVQIGKVGVRPFVRAAWSHSYKQNLKTPVALLDFQDAATVVVSGPRPGHDFATINAGASIQWTPTISTYLSYDGQVGRDNAQSNGISGGFNVSF
jgi:outer membrane autotransporter protein